MAKGRNVERECSCRCGASRLAVNGEPIGRFFCHCLICQAIYKQPYADVTVFWARSVRLVSDSTLDFKLHRRFPGLNRGTCATCHAPVFGSLRIMPLPRLAFVPSQNFPDRGALPTPKRHIFYERRVCDVADGVAKTSGYVPSELFVTGMIMADAVGLGRGRPASSSGIGGDGTSP
jgi:hypothetical protein